VADPASRPRLLLLLPSTTYRATAFVEAARRLDAELTVATDEASVFAARRPDKLVTFDFGSRERAAEQARAFAAGHPVAAVVGVDDDTAVVASAIAAALRLPGNPVEATMAARDKHRQRMVLAAAGVPVPRFRLHRLEEPPEGVARGAEYPCVLKPLCLSASRGVIRASTSEELVAAHGVLTAILNSPDVVAQGRSARYYLVESFVPGPEVALEGLVDGGRLRVLALFDKPDPLEGPYFEETIYVTPSRLDEATQRVLAECAERAVRAMGLVTGPVHAELRVNQQGPWLIEAAARPIGGRCSRVLRFGHAPDPMSLEELILRQALGMPIATFQRETTPAGVMMIPTPGAGVLREVLGVEAARRTPGIEDVEITAHVGQRLVPRPAGSQYVGFIFARAGTAAAAETALRQAHRRLRFVLAAGKD
jgi:biotin carboxylase